MLNFLKSRIGIALMIAVIVIGGALVAKFRMNAPEKNLSDTIKLLADKSLKEGIMNGDASNLEDLFGTSSTSEIIATLESEASSSAPENLTATDRFSRIFLQRYIDLKKSGASIDENTGMRLVTDMLSQDYGSASPERVYTEDDVHIINTTALGDIKKYGNGLAAALRQPVPKGYEQELVIIGRLADQGDSQNSSDIDKLSMNVDHYKKVRDAVAAVSVPFSLKEAHVALLNSLSAILEGVEGMTLIDTDPVGSTKMIARYEDGLSALDLSLRVISAYLKKVGVTYASYESGYILMQ